MMEFLRLISFLLLSFEAAFIKAIASSSEGIHGSGTGGSRIFGISMLMFRKRNHAARSFLWLFIV
ncbi:MAG: hypothetical protein M1592_03700 [Candidatus Thermoplasmatota archaeon]|nr:hypothetical protein [Candidatus Thermoplasmatota archaeon]